MWILPKDLSRTYHTVTGTAALTSDSREFLARMLSQSLLAKSKRLQYKTVLRNLKRDSSTEAYLSIRTLNPSLSASFEDWWTSTLRDFHANLSPVPGQEKPQKTQDICSPSSKPDSLKCSQSGSSLKMLTESSQPESKETDGVTQKELRFCSMSLENWNGWVTKQRREYSLRLKPEPLTSESESSSLDAGKPGKPTTSSQCCRWPTVNVGDAQSGQTKPSGKRCGGEWSESLRVAVHTAENWPTPTNMDTVENRSPESQAKRHSLGLQEKVKVAWPTPCSQEPTDVAKINHCLKTGEMRHNPSGYYGRPRRLMLTETAIVEEVADTVREGLSLTGTEPEGSGSHDSVVNGIGEELEHSEHDGLSSGEKPGSVEVTGNGAEEGQNSTGDIEGASRPCSLRDLWPSRPGEAQGIWEPPRVTIGKGKKSTDSTEDAGEDVGDTERRGLQGGDEHRQGTEVSRAGCEDSGKLGNTNIEGLQGSEGSGSTGTEGEPAGHTTEPIGNMGDSATEGLQERQESGESQSVQAIEQPVGGYEIGATEGAGQPEIEPSVGGDSDGITLGMVLSERTGLSNQELAEIFDWMRLGTSRVEELRLLGNGVVPQAAEKGFRTLYGRLMQNEKAQ